MLQFVWHKIKNKKWLNMCLFAAISLLTAVFTCHPMLEKGADNQLIYTGFTDYAKAQNEFPAVFERNGTYEGERAESVQKIYAWTDSYETKWTEYVEVDTVASQQSLKLSRSNAESNLGKTNCMLSIGLLRDLDAHIRITKGEGLAAQAADGGLFPCIVSEQVMDAFGFVVGEELTFPYVLNAREEPARFVITGFFAEASEKDHYWYHDLAYYKEQIFVSEETFDMLLQEYGYSSVRFEDALLLDYTQMNSENALDYLAYIQEFMKADSIFSANCYDILKAYETQQKTVGTILWVLELPCIVLLLLFIYMVSSQILSTEEGEIATLRSRGVTKGQTVLLYGLQSLIISAGGLLAGMAFGFCMCKAAAKTDAFLHFTEKDVSLYGFRWEMIPYGLAACIIAMLFMTVPVWKRAGITIVEQKSRAAGSDKKPFWERYFLDIILLGVSCYLLYNYNKQSEELALLVMEAKSLDPMVFLNASLFIFSGGLFCLRLSKYLALLIDRMGKKRWKPAMYASFLQITRTFRRQSMISVFLVMTIAGGIFDANMARTMNQNSEERIAYDIGADVRLTDTWKLYRRRTQTEGALTWYYEEPNFEEYQELTAEGICERVTRVLEDDNVDIGVGNKTLVQCRLMGIQTKEFGETAELMDGLNDRHWFYALNALAESEDGVIISRNMAEALELNVGDSVRYTRYEPFEKEEAEVIGSVTGTVCAIVDAFPSYDRYQYVQDEEGNLVEQERYLIVANYASVVDHFAITPYSVWMRLTDGASVKDVTDFLGRHDITPADFTAMEEEISDSKNSALIQITNGMFTMTFMISILVCSVGFLTYWIMSIRSRELMFGIYRAMGMRMKEIHRMLINEQIFGSVLPIAAGGAIGMLGTQLFVRLIALVYLPRKHNIAIRIRIYGVDMAKLFLVILAVVLVCFFALRRLLRNMKIAQALKLGED